MNAQAISSGRSYETDASPHQVALEKVQAVSVNPDVIPLPRGLRDGRGRCPECHGNSLTAVLTGLTSTRDDPDVYCNQCGFLW
jgi:hypothetical protein